MNLLQMMQFVQGNIGTSSDLPFAGPTTVVGVTGQYLEFFNYIQQAYEDVQLDQQEWRFRTQRALLNLIPGQWIYTLAQIRAQIADFEEPIDMHFIDDSQYGLISSPLPNNPAATKTVGAVTLAFDTYNVTVINIGTFSQVNGNGNLVLVTDGTNSIAGPIQSINAKTNTMSFAAEQVTVVGTPTVIPAGSNVTYTGPFIATDVTSQRFCFYYEYQNWRGWKDRQQLPSGTPVFYSKYPDRSMAFNPVPDLNYGFFFDYRTALDVMTQLDASTPKYLPTHFHKVICWKAIMYWAMSRSDGAKYQAALNEYKRIYNKLEQEQLPGVQPYFQEFYG